MSLLEHPVKCSLTSVPRVTQLWFYFLVNLTLYVDQGIQTRKMAKTTYVDHFLENIGREKKTRWFSNHESRLISWSHTYAIIVILDLKIHQSMWIHWPFFPKTWTKGHWSLDDLWPHVCWGHMCDSTQGSLCPSPMGIHQCMWIQWSILQITTYIHTHTYILSVHILRTEWSHSLLLNSVQARQKVV